MYVRSPHDERSPWLLFGKSEDLKTEVTQRFYKELLGRPEQYNPRPAAEVQQFIDAEHAETRFDPRYHGFYDNRFLNPGDVHELPAEPWPQEETIAWLAAWPVADLQQQVEAFRQRQSEYGLLRGLQSGELSLKGKTFPFRGQDCSANDVKRLFETVDKELDAAIEDFHRLDRQVFLAHWSLAHHLDRIEGKERSRETELLARYRFHLASQVLLQRMLGTQARLQAVLGVVSGNSQVSQETFVQVRTALDEAQQALLDILRNAESLHTPALSNVFAGSSLAELIVDRTGTRLPRLADDNISGEWLNGLVRRIEGVLSRLKRVDLKSLGGLLACQERLVKEAQQRTNHARSL